MGWIRPFKRRTIQISRHVNVKKQGRVAPEYDTRDNYSGRSQATGPRIPCGTHVDKKVASDPPLGHNLPGR